MTPTQKQDGVDLPTTALFARRCIIGDIFNNTLDRLLINIVKHALFVKFTTIHVLRTR